MKIDLGCGNNKEVGCVGVDRDQECKPDITHDLEVAPYPFQDSSVDEIFSNHCIEHLKDPTILMSESARILKDGGRITISLPHPSDVNNMWGHPEHQRPLPLNWIETIGAKYGLKVVDFKLGYFDHKDKGVPKWKRSLGSCIDLVANIKPRWFERMFIYWVGGMGEMRVTLVKQRRVI